MPQGKVDSEKLKNQIFSFEQLIWPLQINSADNGLYNHGLNWKYFQLQRKTFQGSQISEHLDRGLVNTESGKSKCA